MVLRVKCGCKIRTETVEFDDKEVMGDLYDDICREPGKQDITGAC